MTRLYKLIDIYSNCKHLVEDIKNLHTKVETLKKLKDAPDDEWKRLLQK